MANVAINGLGRVGRVALRQIMEEPDLQLVAVNDLTPLEDLVYLLRYDSVYGRYPGVVTVDGGQLLLGDRVIRVFREPDPARLPWRSLNVDLVLECSGALREPDQVRQHLTAGARHVILSAPATGKGLPAVVHGVNELDDPSADSFSTASCTTNCIAPVLEILDRHIGIRKAMLTTIHAVTSSQRVVDIAVKNPERGRAAGINMIPTSTGAASAAADVLPGFRGKFDGMAIRVPIITGSIADITCVAERATSVEEVNGVFRREAAGDRYYGILGVADDPIVSSDIIADPRASIIDSHSTRVVDGDLLKVAAWYDNEWGYVSQMVRQARKLLLA